MPEQNRFKRWIDNAAKPPSTTGHRISYMLQDGALAVISYYGSDWLVRESVIRHDYALLFLGMSSLLVSGFAKFAALGNLFLLIIRPKQK